MGPYVMQGRLDVAWRVLDVCQQHNAKPSVVTINSVMGAVQRSETVTGPARVKAALKLIDLIHHHRMQVMCTSCPMRVLCLT